MTTATVPETRADRGGLAGWYKRNEIAVTPWLFLAPAILFFAVYVNNQIFQSIMIRF